MPNSPHRYRDWKKGGHGSVNISEAITQSCDVFFYRLAGMLGIDHIHSFLQQFGFGEKTVSTHWGKNRVIAVQGMEMSKKNQLWFPGETLITGIGQGYLQVTPLQLAKATATLANRAK